jgi:hypothetical protein
MDVLAGKVVDLYAWTAPPQENSLGKTKFPALLHTEYSILPPRSKGWGDGVCLVLERKRKI